jgi:hypothetical protein
VKARAAAVKAQSAALQNAAFPIGWFWIDKQLCAQLADQPVPASAKTTEPASDACWQPSGGQRVLLVLGWLVTILAVSLGANFWFDVLAKALQLRGSGPKISAATGEIEPNKR